VLKELGNASIILNQILDQQISVSARELLGISPTLYRMLFRGDPNAPLSREKKEQAKVNTVRVGLATLSEEEEEILYTIGCLTVRAKVSGVSVTALINSGAEICLMNNKLRKKTGLLML